MCVDQLVGCYIYCMFIFFISVWNVCVGYQFFEFICSCFCDIFSWVFFGYLV